MFFKRAQSGVEWLVVGLGNPGKKYAGTRHNVGFDALEYAAGKWGVDVRRARFDALCGMGEAGGHKVLLLKPQIFMNLSGNSVRQAADFYKIDPGHILVLTDDIALAPGLLRIRNSGSAGGHNGLKSIIGCIGQEFPRIRIGVGERPHTEYDLADWVLGRFTAEERKAVDARRNDIAAAAILIMDGKPAEAMSRYNGAGGGTSG